MIFNIHLRKQRLFHIPKETWGLDSCRGSSKENRSNQFSSLKMEGPGPGLGNLGFPTCPSVTSGSAFQLCESYPGMPPKRALTCVKETAFAAQKLSSLLHGDLSLSPDLPRRFWSRHAFLHLGLSWWSETRVWQAVRTVGLLLPNPQPSVFGDWLALARAFSYPSPPSMTYRIIQGSQDF